MLLGTLHENPARVFLQLQRGWDQMWDTRTMEKSGEVEGAHIMPVRDLDFAKQTGNLLASAGDDHRICVWDLR